MMLATQFYITNPDCSKGLTRTQREVLHVLAAYTSRALGECYTGRETLAQLAHLKDVTNVSSHLKVLQDGGYIAILKGLGVPTASGPTNLYQLGAYREYIGLKRFDDGQGLARLIANTLMQGMKPDKSRAFRLRAAIELSASRYNTALTPDVLSSLTYWLNEQKYGYGIVDLKPDVLRKELERGFFAALAAPAPSRELPDVSSSTAGTPSGDGIERVTMVTYDVPFETPDWLEDENPF